MDNTEVTIKPKDNKTKKECTNCGKESTREAFFGDARIAFCNSLSCEKVAVERAKVMGG